MGEMFVRIDIHAHVLPGVDHGAKDWATSLWMLDQSAQCGVEAIIATPHYLPWKKEATGKSIRQLCQEAQERLQRQYGISMDIYPGQEIYYSTDIVENLESGKALTLAGTQYVLVEFDQGVLYSTLCRAVRELRYKRYIPILAHIERYLCLKQSERLRELKSMGAKFQVNLGSIQGGIFQAESRRVKRWLKKELIDFVASDMHDMSARPPMSEQRLQWMQKNLNPQYQDKLLYGNAKRILAVRKE